MTTLTPSSAFGFAYTLGIPNPNGTYQPPQSPDQQLPLRALNVLEPNQPASVYRDPDGFLVGVTGEERDILIKAKEIKDLARQAGLDSFITQAADEASNSLKRAISINAQMVDVADIVKDPEAFPVASGNATAHLVMPRNPFALLAKQASQGSSTVATDADLNQQAQQLAQTLAQQLQGVLGPQAQIKVKTTLTQQAFDPSVPDAQNRDVAKGLFVTENAPSAMAQPSTVSSPFDKAFGPVGAPVAMPFALPAQPPAAQ
jgi:hypothetical protein